MIELHWDVTERHLSFHFDVEALCRRRRSSTLSADIETLSPENTLIVLCVHGAKHGWPLLLWISDLAAVLQECLKSQSLDWDVLMLRAREAGALRALHLGLLLASEVLSCSALLETAPPSLRTALKKDRIAHRLSRQVAAHLFLSPEERERTVFSDLVYLLRLHESDREKIGYLWRRSTEGIDKRLRTGLASRT